MPRDVSQICIEPGGPWHRRSHDGTRCGRAFPGAFQSRDWVLDGNLCSECFTPRERLVALDQKLQQANVRDADTGLYYSPEEAPTDVGPVDDFDSEGPTAVDE